VTLEKVKEDGEVPENEEEPENDEELLEA